MGVAYDIAIGQTSTGELRIWAGGRAAAGGAFLKYSDNGGTTWVTPSRPGSNQDFILTLLADQSDPMSLLVGMTHDIRATHDGGVTWHVALSMERAGYVSAMERIGSRVYAVTDEVELGGSNPGSSALGLYVSSDGGSTWSTLVVPETATGGYSVTSIADKTILVGTRSGRWSVHFK